jgi:ABC-type glutathione transport system ATPase component
MTPAPLLEVSNLRISFEGDRGWMTEAVSDVSFRIAAGKTLGIVLFRPL